MPVHAALFRAVITIDTRAKYPRHSYRMLADYVAPAKLVKSSDCMTHEGEKHSWRMIRKWVVLVANRSLTHTFAHAVAKLGRKIAHDLIVDRTGVAVAVSVIGRSVALLVATFDPAGYPPRTAFGEQKRSRHERTPKANARGGHGACAGINECMCLAPVRRVSGFASQLL